MARTTSAAVIAVLGRDYDSRNLPSLTPYIDTASSFVDDVVECVLTKELTLTSAKLELIERWLAAHFYQQSDKGYSSKSTAGASASYQGQTGMYLESTFYGQTAVRLDPTGCLQTVAGSERKSVDAFWLGKTEAEQLDYDERN